VETYLSESGVIAVVTAAAATSCRTPTVGLPAREEASLDLGLSDGTMARQVRDGEADEKSYEARF